jgi:ethanolamine utilization microcompartment shell protein EutS
MFSWLQLMAQQIWQEIINAIAYIFPPVVKPAPGTNLTLVNLIEAYNRPVTILYPLYIGPSIGAMITLNTPEQNQLIANTIISAAANVGINFIYLAAVIQQESCFAVNAVNYNISQTNPVSSFATTDWGISQFAGTFLPSKEGMVGLSEEQMIAKVFDPTWSIPMMALIYAGNIATAEKNMSTNTTLASAVHALNTTTFTDAEFLACLAYNRGWSGAINDVLTNQTALMHHPYACANFFKIFTQIFDHVTLVHDISVKDKEG